ncbi:UNVERIFIED_CONTAM: hypothetical protein GTU68_061561 [Idotea baltica]|nr:hypothetical protein [Idotea baltica]
MGKIIGIDLGTTNSCVAVLEGDKPKVIENAEDDDEILVGQAAKRQAVTNPDNTLYAVKRLIGRRFEDEVVQKDIKMVPYKIVKADNGDAWVEVKGDKKAAPQISAEVLKKMKKTVITVPAYFNDSQRQATKDAGKIAGLDVKRATNGDTFLGGEDFDMRLIEYLAVKLTRAKLESLVEELVERSMEPLKLALKDAGKSASDIDEVILVGGQTRMPMVQEKVTEFFGKEPRKDDNQTAVTIHVVQGERKQATGNKSLGRFDLADIPPAQRGMPQIEVTFDIDANGILNVNAKDKATGKEQSIVIKASSGLSDDEIESMVNDAEANAAEDQKFEELVQARNAADGLAHAAKKTLEEAGDKASEEEKTAIEAAIAEVEEAVKGDDKEAMDAAANKLSEASSALAQKLYAEQAEAGQAESPEGAAGDAGADDAVDAEFEEVKEEVQEDDKK